MEGVPTTVSMSCLDSHVAVEPATTWTLTTQVVSVSQDYLEILSFCVTINQILTSVKVVLVETPVSTLMAVFIAAVPPPTLLWTLTVEVAYVRNKK